MDDRVEPPSVLLEPEPFEDGAYERLLPSDRVAPIEHGCVDRLRSLGNRSDERHESFAQLGEDLSDVVGCRAGFVVVEEQIVRLLGWLEAIQVAAAQLDAFLEVG